MQFWTLHFSQEWVIFALCSDRSSRSVAGQHSGFVGKGQQPGFDGFDDLIEIAAGQVGPANAAGKQCVAGDEQLERGEVQANGALGVARGVQDQRRAGFKPNAEAVGERVVWRSRFRGRDAQPPGLRVHHFEQGQVVLIQQDRCAGQPLELERASHVVDVAVGDENLLELEAQFSQASMDAADLVAGIDDNGLSGLLVAKDSAIALQWPDGEGLEDHTPIVGRAGLSQ